MLQVQVEFVVTVTYCMVAMEMKEGNPMKKHLWWVMT